MCVGAVGIEVLAHARADEGERGSLAARIRKVGGQAEAQQGGEAQLLLHRHIRRHQLVQSCGVFDGVQILLDGGHAGFLPPVGVHHAVVQGLDLGLGGAGGLLMGGDLCDQGGDLLIDRQAQTIEGTIDGQTGGDVGAVQPALVHGGIVVVLQVGALIGVDPAQQRVQLVRGQGAVRVAVGNARGADRGKLLGSPGGDVGQTAIQQGHAGVVAYRGGESAEGVGEHHQGLGPGDGAVQIQAAVGIAPQNVGLLDAGDIVLGGRQNGLGGLPPGQCPGGLNRRSPQQQRCGQQQGARRFILFIFFLLIRYSVPQAGHVLRL